MDKSIKECIEFAFEQGFILFGNYSDLKQELDDLEQDQIALTNIKLYGEENPNEN